MNKNVNYLSIKHFFQPAKNFPSTPMLLGNDYHTTRSNLLLKILNGNRDITPDVKLKLNICAIFGEQNFFLKISARMFLSADAHNGFTQFPCIRGKWHIAINILSRNESFLTKYSFFRFRRRGEE